MKAYLLSFDPNFANVPSVHAVLLNTPGVLEWWHYLSGTYILTSSSDIVSLDDAIKTSWPDGWYILVEVKKPMVGLLTEEGWNWINSRLPS